MRTISRDTTAMRSGPAAYLLWLLCFVGLCGMHRFYAGKPLTGLLWLFTFGLLGIGQILDLFLIPSMLRQRALEARVYRMEYEREVLRRG